jgi:polar amino acid transport system permease protein
VPPTGNQYVDAIKDSSILSIIGVPELMRMTQQQANVLYRPFEFYTTAGILYFIAVLVVSKLISFTEMKTSLGIETDSKNLKSKPVVMGVVN